MIRALWERLAFVAGTGFGLGYAPKASGTVGTLPGVLLVLVTHRAGLGLEIAIAIGLALLAIPICDVAERRLGKKDDGRIVADEYLTFPLCMLGLPREPWLLAVAFLSVRFFDVVKPPPARRLQSLGGGLGVAIDDVFASLYSLAANWVVYWAVQWWLARPA